MGEIVDLEIYRKRLKRKGARAQGAGNRRNPDPPASRAEPSAPKAGSRKPRLGDSGKRGSSGNAKIEPSDPKPD